MVELVLTVMVTEVTAGHHRDEDEFEGFPTDITPPEELISQSETVNPQTTSSDDKDLYGYPLGPMKSSGLSVVAIVGIGLGSGLVSLMVSFTVVCIWLRVTDRKMAAEQEGKITQLMPEY